MVEGFWIYLESKKWLFIEEFQWGVSSTIARYKEMSYSFTTILLQLHVKTDDLKLRISFHDLLLVMFVKNEKCLKKA